jgi:hypothetical protein
MLSVLTRRYSKGNPETDIDYDIRQIEAAGLVPFCETVIASELSDNFWSNLLPLELETSSLNSPYFLAYQAAHVKMGDKGFLSRDITVLSLLRNRSDVHHVYPRNYLKKQGLSRSRYNQIANFVLAQSEINIAIGEKSPEQYFGEIAEQCAGGRKRYGNIDNRGDMLANLRMNCLPVSLLDGDIPAYEEFLDQRRRLMAQKISRKATAKRPTTKPSAIWIQVKSRSYAKPGMLRKVTALVSVAMIEKRISHQDWSRPPTAYSATSRAPRPSQEPSRTMPAM